MTFLTLELVWDFLDIAPILPTMQEFCIKISFRSIQLLCLLLPIQVFCRKATVVMLAIMNGVTQGQDCTLEIFII